MGGETAERAGQPMSEAECRHMEAVAAQHLSVAVERLVKLVEKLLDTAEADKR